MKSMETASGQNRVPPVDHGGPAAVALEATAAEVAHLTVVYDGTCALCRRCRRWVEQQPQLVPFRFVASSEPWVQRWLGGLVPVGDDLVVVDDGGRAWVGPDAFVVCLWGLSRHRKLAMRLQRAGGRLLAKHIFHSVSGVRGMVSYAIPDPDCPAGSCTA
jgi:predicted DCC family thiol-disulfide oxidoreductase YuxK